MEKIYSMFIENTRLNIGISTLKHKTPLNNAKINCYNFVTIIGI
jgi:hypothetical protein